MKKIIIALCAVCFSFNLIAQDQFTFSGKITGATDLHVILMFIDNNGKSIKDSSILQNGAFSFKGSISSPVMAYFTVNADSFKMKPDDDLNTATVFLEPGNITATGNYGHLQELKIAGSKTHAEYEKLREQIAELTAEKDKLSKKFDAVLVEYQSAKKDHPADKKTDSLNKQLEIIRGQYEGFDSRYGEVVHRYITVHPSSYVSAFELRFYASSWPVDSIRMLYNNFSADVRKSPYGQEVQKAIANIDDNSPGKKAKDFATKEINGHPLSLADFKGKVILLDFWASWCGPCRASTPHLIDLYKKYHGLGFDVIAIAEDDGAKDAWAKAIAQDHSELWHNVLAGFHTGKAGDDIPTKFAVSLLPTRILIDRNGVIIARYTQEAEALDKKLVEIFK